MSGALLGAVSQGILWGIMVLGVFITYKLLDIPDLTVDGSFATGGEAAVDRQVGDVEQLVCDEDAEHHDAPENALGDGAKQSTTHVVPPSV